MDPVVRQILRAGSSRLAWWREAVLYRVDVPTFRDSDGDGIGDVDGLTESLPYLAELLSVDALWLSRLAARERPDQTTGDVDADDLAAFDRLLASAHLRGLRVIIDYVADGQSAEDPPQPGSDPGVPERSIWRSPLRQAAMLRAFRFWLERGVDGFCVRLPQPDAAGLLEEPRNLLRQLRRVVDEYGDRVAFGDVAGSSWPETGDDPHPDELPIPINRAEFDEHWAAGPADALLEQLERTVDAESWTVNLLGDELDAPIASRLGTANARAAAMLQLTAPGTPVVHSGDELGMVDALGADTQLFTDFRRSDVELQLRDQSSMLALYRRLIDLRRVRVALRRGGVRRLEADAPGCLLYERSWGESRTIVALNFEDGEQTVTLPEHGMRAVLSTAAVSEADTYEDQLVLRGYEGVVLDTSR